VQIFHTSCEQDRAKRLADIEKLRKNIQFEGHTTDFDLMLLNNGNVSIVMNDGDFDRTYKLFVDTYWKGLRFSVYFADKTGVLRPPHGG
jgi:hypothetical protein